MAIIIDKTFTPISYSKEKNLISSHFSNFKYIPKPYVDVAKGMEQQYVKFMIDQMNNTIKRSDNNSNGQNYYQSLLDDQRVKTIVNHGEGGLGLQKIILEQIYPQKFRNKFAYDQFQHTQQNKKQPSIQMRGPIQKVASKTTNRAAHNYPNKLKE